MRGQWANDAWQRMKDAIAAETLDVTLRYPNLVQDIVVHASHTGKRVRLIKLGAGVTRVISDTGKCPCCGKILEAKP